eukprot:3761509-Pyramimonas_sp.AAC.1
MTSVEIFARHAVRFGVRSRGLNSAIRGCGIHEACSARLGEEGYALTGALRGFGRARRRCRCRRCRGSWSASTACAGTLSGCGCCASAWRSAS